MTADLNNSKSDRQFGLPDRRIGKPNSVGQISLNTTTDSGFDHFYLCHRKRSLAMADSANTLNGCSVRRHQRRKSLFFLFQRNSGVDLFSFTRLRSQVVSQGDILQGVMMGLPLDGLKILLGLSQQSGFHRAWTTKAHKLIWSPSKSALSSEARRMHTNISSSSSRSE